MVQRNYLNWKVIAPCSRPVYLPFAQGMRGAKLLYCLLLMLFGVVDAWRTAA